MLYAVTNRVFKKNSLIFRLFHLQNSKTLSEPFDISVFAMKVMKEDKHRSSNDLNNINDNENNLETLKNGAVGPNLLVATDETTKTIVAPSETQEEKLQHDRWTFLNTRNRVSQVNNVLVKYFLHHQSKS